jgi:hypothetical protein
VTTEQLIARVEALEARVAALEGPLPPVDENRVGPSQRHSDTSRLAALNNFPRSGSQRAEILDFLLFRGDRGATRQEIHAHTGISDDSVRPRVGELIDGGWARGTDQTRRTPLGEQAEVLVATSRARIERLAKTEDVRQVVSPAPVVSDESAALAAVGTALRGLTIAADSSETTALFDLPTEPQSAIGDWDGE